MKNFTIKLTFAVIISAFVFSSAQAQMEKEDLSLNYSYIGEGDSGSHQKIAFSKFEAKANLYRKFTKKGALYFHTVSYANMNIDYSAELGIPTELEQFHSFSYSIGASVPLKNEWRLTGVFLQLWHQTSKVMFNSTIYSFWASSFWESNKQIKKSTSEYWSHVFQYSG